MKKNPNGLGTVYKLAGNRSNPYIARVTKGWVNKPDGTKKQSYYTVGYFKTRAEAIRALNNYVSGGIVEVPHLTFSKLYGEWSDCHFDKISESTQRQYTAAFKNLEPLHNAKFTSLRTAHYQKCINDLTGSLKKGSLEKIKLLIVMLYDYALQNDLCAKNYGKFIKLPKETKTEKEIFNDMEIKKLFDNVGVPYADTILILIYTGMRVNEMLSLTVFNIDMDKGFLTCGLKTEAGKNRIVPVHHKIKPYLAKYIAASRDGRLIGLSYTRYMKIFKDICARLDIKNKTPHCCRHTFASLMARAGVSPQALQKIIGHADYSTTANIYTHFNRDTLAKEMMKLK